MRNTTARRQSVKRQLAFKKALLDEGITLTEFAASLEIHRVHLTRAFREPAAVGQWIHDAIDALIQKHGHSIAA